MQQIDLLQAFQSLARFTLERGVGNLRSLCISCTTLKTAVAVCKGCLCSVNGNPNALRLRAPERVVLLYHPVQCVFKSSALLLVRCSAIWAHSKLMGSNRTKLNPIWIKQECGVHGYFVLFFCEIHNVNQGWSGCISFFACDPADGSLSV